MVREMGIMRDVKFGVRDISKANLSFTVDCIVGSSLQILGVEETVKLIERHQITDISRLEGHACIVETEKPDHLPLGVSRFIDLHN